MNWPEPNIWMQTQACTENMSCDHLLLMRLVTSDLVHVDHSTLFSLLMFWRELQLCSPVWVQLNVFATVWHVRQAIVNSLIMKKLLTWVFSSPAG